MNQEDKLYLDDEISLVDLGAIFVRRVWLFILLFTLFVMGGIVFALVQDEQYEYVSLYQIAEVGVDQPVERPAKAIAVLQSRSLPELKAAYRAEHGAQVPFKVRVSNPESTSMLRISSESVKGGADDVRAFHSELMQQLQSRHQKQIADVRKSLEARVDSVGLTLDALKEAPDAGQAVGEVMQKRVELEGKLAALSSSELIVVGRESFERIAPNRKLIVVFSVAIGFVVGIVAVYFAEFASLVRQALRERK